ncbi:hypothetical protein TNCV_1450741 [Trichonephila clavipes]|nr:hypothetical protein TNCV_1450741 [Trichonephila clavipes]
MSKTHYRSIRFQLTAFMVSLKKTVIDPITQTTLFPIMSVRTTSMAVWYRIMFSDDLSYSHVYISPMTIVVYQCDIHVVTYLIRLHQWNAPSPNNAAPWLRALSRTTAIPV